METICNGIRIPRVAFDVKDTERLIKVIHEERENMRQKTDHDLGLYCGDRFEDDEVVISTMESADRERLFARGDHAAVRDALVNCMSRDYWYRFEKDWG